MSQKRIGHKPINGFIARLGMTKPSPSPKAQKRILMNKESLKNLIVNGTVPISSSSYIADGI